MGLLIYIVSHLGVCLFVMAVYGSSCRWLMLVCVTGYEFCVVGLRFIDAIGLVLCYMFGLLFDL